MPDITITNCAITQQSLISTARDNHLQVTICFLNLTKNNSEYLIFIDCLFMLSFFDSWLPFIYLYVAGGIFFFTGIFLIKRSGAIDLTIKRHRFWFKVMIAGFFYFAVMH